MKERLKRILLQKYKISYDISEELFGEGLLNEKDCIKFLIKHEYKPLMSKDGRDTAMVVLSERYFVSSSTVWEYVYR